MSSLAWIVLAVFALAWIGGWIRRRTKDACLRFLDGDRVTFLACDGETMWGTMDLTSQGLELGFDAPHVDERGLVEAGAIVYRPELSDMLGLCRCAQALAEDERRARDRQVRAILDPSPWRRTRRSLGNVGGMVRDALVDALGLVAGQVGTRNRPAAALASRQKQVTEVGGALLDLGARAYEPLLERHVGKAVIVRVDAPDKKPAWFPGFLADYNEKFVVLVNEDHAPEESLELVEGVDASGARLAREGEKLVLRCTGPDAIVVKRVVGSKGTLDLGAVLLPGGHLTMHVPRGFELRHAEVDRTRKLDLVVPRTRGRIRFASTRPPTIEGARDDWTGVGPG